MGDETNSFFEDDEIMREIRTHRREYAARFNNDIHAIFEDLRKKQAEYVEKYGLKVVSRPPRMLKDRNKAE